MKQNINFVYFKHNYNLQADIAAKYLDQQILQFSNIIKQTFRKFKNVILKTVGVQRYL